MTAAPTISVVMAAYNGAALIGDTLDSLARQSFADFEVIVVDDCSKDDTRAVVAGWPDARVRLVALDANGGPVHARNRAVAEARGRYIAALDQDDLCHPERFARQVAWLDAHPDIALLGTAAQTLSDGRIGRTQHAPVTTPALVAWLSLIENPLVWSSVMIRADIAHMLDPFSRAERLYAEDFDLYHRIRRHGGIARIDDPLTTYRQHAGGVSRRFRTAMRSSATAVLADAHARALGAQSESAADLFVRYNMEGTAVPDRATLARLGTAISRAQAAFLDDHAVDTESLRLIRWETAQRWARIGRAGLRAGTIDISDVMACRPAHLGLGYAGLEGLVWSGAIGGLRKMARRRR
jgi:glycosyltransferase involved in cell wall biosynthesis